MTPARRALINPRRAGRAYDAICKTLSERQTAVDWAAFTQDDWQLFAQMAETEGVAPLLHWIRKTGVKDVGGRGEGEWPTEVREFLQASLHPDHRRDNDDIGAREWAENSTWHGLEIVATEAGGPDDDVGQVEFVATYTTEGDEQAYREIAEFDRIDGQWYFREGKPPVRHPIVRQEPKIGRNDPCSCGSGRKYKKCCGS